MGAYQVYGLFQPWMTQLTGRPEALVSVLLGLCFLWGIKGLVIKIYGKTSKARVLDAPGFPSVEPLEDFDWRTTEPLKLRPFKPKYHLTMALGTLNPSELIPMDKTYKERLALRKTLLKEQHDVVVAVNDDSDKRIRAAVTELYTFVMGTYLPGRYPTMFRCRDQVQAGTGKVTVLDNLVTEEVWPVILSDTAPTIRALETLIQVVDEDFLILLPEKKEKKNFAIGRESSKNGTIGDNDIDDGNGAEPKYILEAYGTCFPSGFNTRKKLGLRLASIHEPVPYYGEKLERSMDRFFARVEVGKYVQRVNWSITTNTELFAADKGTHGAQGEKLEEIKPGQLDVDRTVVRCERQTLHRLPGSRALVFAFHTYTYPIRDIKEEGQGENLAQAIDGLKEGSAPRIHFYKRGSVWGEAVKGFLRR